MRKNTLNILVFLMLLYSFGLQAQVPDTVQRKETYKKRVLESTEVDFLFGYYNQDGNNAAVSGGLGTEELTDVAPTVVVAIPLNDDDVLTIDASVSAYSSASSSNVGPFDGNTPADPFVASSGASSNDVLATVVLRYAHSDYSRNNTWSAQLAIANEYDYFSLGFGGSYAHLFNQKNTEFSINGNVYLDKWNAIYPVELRSFSPGGIGLQNVLFTQNTITGNANYSPVFIPFENEQRKSYSIGLGLSQLLSKKLQGSILLDVILQDGLLSTPFQRVYFSDVSDSFIDNFQLADDVERLPETRLKIPIGARLNYFLNDYFILRTYYRFYYDDWGIRAHTASLEIPIKVSDAFSVYPSYRYYSQSAATHFFEKETALSNLAYYTSDFDLSAFYAQQYGLGFRYKDIFTTTKLFGFGLKSIDLRLQKYDRSNGLNSFIASLGTTFVAD